MNNLRVTSHQQVEEVFNKYPEEIQVKMRFLRQLVLQVAHELDEISEIEETLKWGEPSYLTPHGSTLRMDWKEKTPHQYQMYFKCTSRLVDTFKIIFGNIFTYDGSRAIVFRIDEEVPVKPLIKCITATLLYHKVKKDQTLGL